MPLTALDIAESLTRLGIVAGDMLYIRARLSAVGAIMPPAGDTVVRGLLEVIGPDGLVVAPAFTDMRPFWQSRRVRFDLDAPTNTGLLGRALLKHPDRKRSRHPSHSFVAVGRGADKLVEGHDASRPAFWLMKRLVDCNAKMVIVGCNTESPGFSTVHLVQEELGLSRLHYAKLIYRCEYVDENGAVHLWRPKEEPGCSRGFDKVYRHYIADDNFHIGRVGSALAIRVDAARAYEVEKKLLGQDPRSILCDHKDCISCRVTRGYNLKATAKALLRLAIRHARSQFQGRQLKP